MIAYEGSRRCRHYLIHEIPHLVEIELEARGRPRSTGLRAPMRLRVGSGQLLNQAKLIYPTSSNRIANLALVEALDFAVQKFVKAGGPIRIDLQNTEMAQLCASTRGFLCGKNR